MPAIKQDQSQEEISPPQARRRHKKPRINGRFCRNSHRSALKIFCQVHWISSGSKQLFPALQQQPVQGLPVAWVGAEDRDPQQGADQLGDRDHDQQHGGNIPSQATPTSLPVSAIASEPTAPTTISRAARPVARQLWAQHGLGNRPACPGVDAGQAQPGEQAKDHQRHDPRFPKRRKRVSAGSDTTRPI